MAVLKRLMQAGVALAISVGSSFCVYAQRAAAELPRDVTEFVNRRASCTEWSKKAIEVGTVDSNGWYLCFDIIDTSARFDKNTLATQKSWQRSVLVTTLK